MFILFLFVSFVSFRQCKVTVIFSRFQENVLILFKLVWTNEQSLDKSQKQTQKLSKGIRKTREGRLFLSQGGLSPCGPCEKNPPVSARGFFVSEICTILGSGP